MTLRLNWLRGLVVVLLVDVGIPFFCAHLRYIFIAVVHIAIGTVFPASDLTAFFGNVAAQLDVDLPEIVRRREQSVSEVHEIPFQ